ncbi:hypothetical protein C1645_823283 [Glomus cerebriforme]|uniref:Uncharacterized protein n=1 Tax=Glomus cerebriforme TaxID=658196 RepID=A0A397SXX2_9GLOM|nr:hypothetical protein C1645_823283 [Glomus cerebriforme]
MAKLHAYYITNAYDDDEDEVDNEDEDEDGTNNNSGINEYLNLASEELRQLLEVQVVEVRIERQPVDHGEKEFDEMKTALETDFRYIAIENDFEELNANFREQL